MPIKFIKELISKAELLVLAKERFGDLVKAVVDIERAVMVVGGELHADEEEMLLEDGSKQENLWGINLYPEKSGDDFVEFDSMINIRPSQGNRSRGVESKETQEKIKKIVCDLVQL
jgi:hypothetical protein